MKRTQRILVFTLGGITAGGLLAGWNWRDQKRRATEVGGFCNAEASAAVPLERNRDRIEDWMKGHTRTDEGRALVEQLHRSTATAAANALSAYATQASVTPCPAVEGYGALARRNARQIGLDKVCREMNPVAVERAPRATRLQVVADWARANVKDLGVDAALAPLLAVPLEAALADLRQLLADHEVHVCSLLEALASPIDARPGPNVFLRFVRVQDSREKYVAAAVRSKIPAVMECYADDLRKTPLPAAIAGALNVTFLVTEKGGVERVRVEETTLRPAVALCASRAFETISVPAGSAAVAGGVSLDLFVVK